MTERVCRSDVLRHIASEAGVSVSTARRMYEALTGLVIESAARGAEVQLLGFGRFYPVHYPGGPVAYGEIGAIGPYTVLKFSASRETNALLKGRKP